ncbi:hypothetical protein ACPW7J_03850 [Ihubacter sp. rT4E-8]|uniref:hypothetical protein n=1 Tax=unclassified Ihubacter TaxID=2633299 RepID=UPI00137AE876
MDDIDMHIEAIEDALLRSGAIVDEWDHLMLRAILEDRIPPGGLGVYMKKQKQKQMNPSAAEW